jgi:hypothetical protein
MSLEKSPIMKSTKILSTDNSEKTIDESKLSKTKTYQGDGSFMASMARRKKLVNPEIKRLQRLQKGREIIKNIAKNFSKQNSLFITGFDGQIKAPYKMDTIKFRIPRMKLKSDVQILKNYNVFETEDDFIKKIMYKFYLQENNKKENEKKRKRMVLDKIYGFSPYHTQSLKKAKQKKYLSLQDYQNNILTVFAQNFKNIEHSKLIDLIQNLKDLRAETESITPLPKINIETIRNHVKTKGTKNLKKISIREYLLKDKSPLDDFEKENLIINKLKTQRHISHVQRNKRNKNLDNLPDYIREKFDNQIKYHG